MSDLSSSSTSENDSKSTIHYASAVVDNGSIKLKKAQSRKKHHEMTIMCNRKINYFMEKYVHVDPSKVFFVY